MPRYRPNTIHDAIELLREEIRDRQIALKVLYELAAKYPAEPPAPIASTPPPPLGVEGEEREELAAVLELPKRDAG